MTPSSLDHYLGCLLGGATGDALGAPIEFMDITEIRRRFGPEGVTDYFGGAEGTGRFTDDTQMTLFTAEGLLRAAYEPITQGTTDKWVGSVYQSYLRWLITQKSELPANVDIQTIHSGWLIQQKGLHARRAPGYTCLSALQSGKIGSPEKPINNSKGCGGVMRIAPVGLFFYHNPQLAFDLGLNIAAITHSHPSGYFSAACLASILAFLVQGQDLMSAIRRTLIFLRQKDHHQECLAAIENAIGLYHTHPATPENIERLGGGRVGEEALAIALFCALHYPTNFPKGVLAAVNHSGDCDSTAAITGNILGLMLGKGAIPTRWIARLEMADVIEQIANDLYQAAHRKAPIQDPGWLEKYPPFAT